MYNGAKRVGLAQIAITLKYLDLEAPAKTIALASNKQAPCRLSA